MSKIRKFIVFTLVFVMIITSVVYLPLLSEAKSKYYNYSPDKKGKTTENVNMRSGASTSNKKIITVPKDKSIPIYGYMEVPGKNWYKIKYSGKTGYVRRDYVKITSSSSATESKSSITGSSISYPTTLTQGKGFIVKGTVKSTYKIKELKAGIMEVSTGKYYTSYTGTAKPNATSYNLSKLDSKVAFNKVKPGTYYYAVWAKDIKGKSVYVLKKKFTVKEENDTSESTSTSITGTGIKYPTTLTQGKGFVVKGTVKSTYKLREVKAGIMKSSTDKFSTDYTGSAKPNTTTYDLNNLDAKVAFSKVKPGTYCYAVWAKDIKGKSVYVLKKNFTVKAKNSSSSNTQTTSKYHAYSSSKKGKTNEAVRLRKGSSTSTAIITTVPKSKSVTVYGYDEVTGLNWYKVKYGDKIGYIRQDYVDIVNSNNISDITSFPASYQPLLKELQEKHPNWKFIPQNTGISWNTLISKEMRTVSRQLVEPTSPDSWKSKEPGAYDKKTGKYVKFDGRWNAASKAIVKYYLDPRNFLNDSSIYQFMDHEFNSTWQNKKTIASGVANPYGSFLAKESYYKWIYNSGKNSGVNPNVIASMLIMEQGWKGTSSLISGTYKGYKGYYNYFNIGAYTTSDMSSVERGLWYAKGQNQGLTSWNRPWNTREKSITGGAQFYKAQYMDNGQDTFYTKKFNVVNGASNAGTHEYCTNVTAADGEGKILRRGFVDNSNLPLEFKIPVYENMPSQLCKKPN